VHHSPKPKVIQGTLRLIVPLSSTTTNSETGSSNTRGGNSRVPNSQFYNCML